VRRDPCSPYTLRQLLRNNPILLVDPFGLKDYNELETQQFIVDAYESATGGPTIANGLVNIYVDLNGNRSTGKVGRFDFGNQQEHWDDTFLVGGQRYTADEFGNFIAGFEGKTWEDKYNGGLPFALPLVHLGGIFYHLAGNSKAHNDPWDTTGFPAIRAGARFADQFATRSNKSAAGSKYPCEAN